LGVGVVSSIDVGDVPCAGIGARLNVGSLITAASGLLLLLGSLPLKKSETSFTIRGIRVEQRQPRHIEGSSTEIENEHVMLADHLLVETVRNSSSRGLVDSLMIRRTFMPEMVPVSMLVAGHSS